MRPNLLLRSFKQGLVVAVDIQLEEHGQPQAGLVLPLVSSLGGVGSKGLEETQGVRCLAPVARRPLSPASQAARQAGYIGRRAPPLRRRASRKTMSNTPTVLLPRGGNHLLREGSAQH